MSHDTRVTGSSVREAVGRFDFPRLLATTVALVAATILLGVAAKATASGLACDANWPLCDGGLLNLFPANFPSFFEWIHRVVAMVAGFAIVAVALSVWARALSDRRVTPVTVAVTLGALLTPVQVALGRETVLSYELTILNLHFWVAIAIFVLFAASAVAVWRERFDLRHVRGALLLGVAAVPVHVALSPVFIGRYTSVIQTMQYAVTLALVFAVVVAAIAGRRLVTDRVVAVVLAAAPALAILVLYFSRETVMGFDPAIDLIYLLAAAVTFVALLAAAVLVGRADAPRVPAAN